MLITNTGVGPNCPQENPRTAIRAKEWVTGTVGSKAKQRILDMATAKE